MGRSSFSAVDCTIIARSPSSSAFERQGIHVTIWIVHTGEVFLCPNCFGREVVVRLSSALHDVDCQTSAPSSSTPPGSQIALFYSCRFKIFVFLLRNSFSSLLYSRQHVLRKFEISSSILLLYRCLIFKFLHS